MTITIPAGVVFVIEGVQGHASFAELATVEATEDPPRHPRETLRYRFQANGNTCVVLAQDVSVNTE